MVQIVSLCECPQYAPILAWWSYIEWYQERDVPFEIVMKSYQTRAQQKRLPASFVAIHSGLPVGMASLKADDLWSRRDLGPWLASLYVHPPYRSMGIGSDLIKTICAEAAQQGYSRLYLFLARDDSAELENFYNKRGWCFLEKAEDNDGYGTSIYYYDIHRQ